MARLDERTLDDARRRGDPDADRAVAEIGPRAWAVNALLAPLSSHDDPLPAGVPLSLVPLVVPALPAFADPHRLRAAQAFAQRHLPAITVALFCASLPASYGDAEGARLLAATGRMRHDLDRRVNETARFVFEVLRPNGFDRGGRARLAIGKVRLVHAAVRATLAGRFASTELLINQEQLLGTLCLFSVVVLDAVERLGIRVERRDAEDYVHLWCVVGALLGVDPALLPESRAEGAALLAALRLRRFAPTAEGKALMGELLAGMEHHAAFVGMRSAPGQLVHVLLGDHTADVLGVPRGAAGAPRWMDALTGRWRPRPGEPSAATVKLGRILLETMNAVKLGGARADFPMPAHTGS